MTQPYADDFPSPVLENGTSPLHGYRGTEQVEPAPGGPAGLTIALSREAGARGATIAKRAGEKLGWDVYSQEMLEYVAQNGSARQELKDKLTPSASAWIDRQLQQLLDRNFLSQNPLVRDLTRVVLTLGVQGNVILLGRGAGFIVPARSTLHVRLIAPLEDRIAYMSQLLRQTREEAEAEVRTRDHRRADFLATHFHRKPNDVHVYDMILNTSLLGEERCAELIAAAAKAKMSAVVGMD